MDRVQVSKQLCSYKSCGKRWWGRGDVKGRLSSKLSPQVIHVGLHPRDTSPGETTLPLALLCTGKVFGLHSWGWIWSVVRQAASKWHILCKLPTCNNATRSWHATELETARVAQSCSRCWGPTVVKAVKIPVGCRTLNARGLQTQLTKTNYLSSTTHTIFLLFQP